MYSNSTTALMNALGKGKANAVRREELAATLCVEDSTMRRWIAYARLEGLPICNDMDGNGYYIADTVEEAHAERDREKRRALNLLAKTRPLKEAARKLDREQMRLPFEPDGYYV